MNRRWTHAGIASVLLLTGFSASALFAQGQKPAENITSEQAIACIQTAIAKHPGRVESLDVDVKAGKVLCEVEIAGEGGRKMELHVDVTTNQVVESRPD